MGYKNLSIIEKTCIATLYEQGITVTHISQLLEVSKQTVTMLGKRSWLRICKAKPSPISAIHEEIRVLCVYFLGYDGRLDYHDPP